MARSLHATVLERPDQYAGQSTVAISASQVPHLTPRQQAKLIDDWCHFFADGPSDIWDLTFGMRMPKRLFDALSTQSQLRRLSVSWGVFDSLEALESMTHLVELELESATSLTSLEPLRSLKKLQGLEIGGAWRLEDYSVIGTLTDLRQLQLGGGPGSHPQYAESLDFLTELRALRWLLLSVVPRELDYRPLLELTWVETMAVWSTQKIRKTMTPSMVDLEWGLPGLQRQRADSQAGRYYEWRRGERIGDYRPDSNGHPYLYLYEIAENQ